MISGVLQKGAAAAAALAAGFVGFRWFRTRGPAQIAAHTDARQDAAARQLAPKVAADINANLGGYSRTLLEQFQTAAGLVVDGLYGGRSAGALMAFGVATPPAVIYASKRPPGGLGPKDPVPYGQ